MMTIAGRGRCQYSNGKCINEKTMKRNGDTHTLCEEHRKKACVNQKKLDRKRSREREEKKKQNFKKFKTLKQEGTVYAGCISPAVDQYTAFMSSPADIQYPSFTMNPFDTKIPRYVQDCQLLHLQEKKLSVLCLNSLDATPKFTDEEIYILRYYMMEI